MSEPGPWSRPRSNPSSPPPPPRGPFGPSRGGGPTAPAEGGRFVWNLISSLLLLGVLAYLMGPYVAIGGLVGVFVHEYGHVLAMNRLGCGPARIVIIPFLGGAAIPARPASTEFRDVLISLAGPSFGLLAMLPFVGLAVATGNAEWFKAAFFVAFINLLNLAPAPPLDGSKALGPVLARIHPMVEKAALVAVGGAAIWWAASRGSWILAVFLGLGVLQALRQDVLRAPAFRLSPGQFGVAIALYVGAALLCVMALAISLNGMGRPATLESVADIFAFGR